MIHEVQSRPWSGPIYSVEMSLTMVLMMVLVTILMMALLYSVEMSLTIVLMMALLCPDNKSRSGLDIFSSSTLSNSTRISWKHGWCR